MALTGVSQSGSTTGCDKATTGASDGVPEQIGVFSEISGSALKNTTDALGELAGLTRVGYAGANYGKLENWKNAFKFDPVGLVPQYNHQSNIPDYNVAALKVNQIDPSINVGTAPVDDTTKVTPNYPSKPLVKDPTAPGDAPKVNAIALPDAPLLKDIADPRILDIVLPTAPPISFPDFNGVAPSTDGINPPGETFYWSEEDYDSAILKQVQGEVSRMLAGGVGIPDAIWNALWDKGREREDHAGIKLTQEVKEFFAESGFSLPSGAQTARVKEAQQAVHNSSNALSRDIADQQARHEIENLRFAVQQGMALEGMLGGWYQQQLSRMLDSAKFSYQASITLYEAQITLFNAELQLYSTEAQVYQSLLQAEVTKLEIYRTELDAQKLLGALNQQAVDLYVAQYKALETQISLYNSQLESVTVALEVDKTKLQAYGIEVDAYGKMIQAKMSEYEAYKTEIDAEKSKIDAYGIEVKAFSERVGAYKTQIEVEALTKKIAIDVNDGNIAKFKAELDAYNSKVQSELTKLESSVRVFDSQVKAYGVSTDNETKRLYTDMEALKLDINYASQKTQSYISNAQIYTDKSKAEAGFSLESAKAVAAINAQITASSFSAVNLSMGMSDSASNSVSCLK